MKYYYLFGLLLVFLISSCEKEKKISEDHDIFNLLWADNNSIIIEGGMMHTTNQVDTINNVLTGDTLLPIIPLADGHVIVQRHEAREMKLHVTDTSTSLTIISAEFKSDTSVYQILEIGDQNFLAIFSNSSGNRIFKQKGNLPGRKLKTKSQQPVISLEGMIIGQSINPGKIDILESDQFGPVSIVYATLKSDESIYLRLKQGYFIDQIEKLDIPEKEAKKLIDSFTKDFGVDPVITESVNELDYPPSDVVAYYWNDKDVTVYVKFVKTSSWDDQQEVKESWNVIINNYIITNILETLYSIDDSAV